jgi:hypothetical protein
MARPADDGVRAQSVAAVVGMATVPFDITASTAVPHLVPADRLAMANSWLGTALLNLGGAGMGGLFFLYAYSRLA